MDQYRLVCVSLHSCCCSSVFNGSHTKASTAAHSHRAQTVPQSTKHMHYCNTVLDYRKALCKCVFNPKH
eukprot:6427-Heterococcus_DN1.PRE.11